MEEKIRQMMRNFMEIEPLDNATFLAEETAYAFGCDKWLDDPNHIVWEIALEFFD